MKRFNTFRMVCSAVLLTAGLAMIGCGKRVADRPVTIGVTASISGNLAFWGESIRDGMMLANEEYNKLHPSSPVRIIYEDNQSDSKMVIAAMRKLCGVDHAACVVGVMTPFSKPLRPLAAELKTPILGTVVASLNFGAENEWSFRDYPTPDQLSARVAEYGYHKLGLRRAVCLHVNDEYGKDSESIFAKRFSELGGQVLGVDTVSQSDTDVRAQVTKLLTQTPDCVFLAIRENAQGVSVRQFRELGFKGQILGINAFDSPVVWRVAGEHGEGVVFTSALIDYEGNPVAKSFADAFNKKHPGVEIAHTYAYGYSIGMYLMDLAAKAGGDPIKMRDLMESFSADSIRGPISMAPTRDVLSPVAVYQRRGGKNVIVEK